MTDVRIVATPHGDARLYVDHARRSVATLVLGHGAGKGVDAPDLAALADALPGQGFTVVRVEQPWKVAGKRIASAPRILDESFVAAVRGLRADGPRGPLAVGGRSAGARSACRTARALGAAGVLALAFPLHPPGRPERSRADELLGVAGPVLVVQGDNDPFGTADELPAAYVGEAVAVPYADHGFKVAKTAPFTQDEALAIVVEAVLEWLVREVAGE